MVIWHSLRGCGEEKSIFKRNLKTFSVKTEEETEETHKVMMVSHACCLGVLVKEKKDIS